MIYSIVTLYINSLLTYGKWGGAFLSRVVLLMGLVYIYILWDGK